MKRSESLYSDSSAEIEQTKEIDALMRRKDEELK
jgi:hypothetical protein